MSPPPTSTSSGEPISDLVSSHSYSTVSYLLALTEVILVIMKMDGLRHGLVVANLYTIGQNTNALLFSQRTHLQPSVTKHDVINSEGFL